MRGIMFCSANHRVIHGGRCCGLVQPVAWALPPTYVFEGMRARLVDHACRAIEIHAFEINIVFLLRDGAFCAAQKARKHGRCCSR